jgi:intracellular sulfur oxidation DsrE/DsrF family protein
LTTRSYLTVVLTLLVTGWLGAAPVFASDPLDDSAALHGIEETKSVFLIKRDSAAKTDAYLKGIRATYQGMQDQGVQMEVCGAATRHFGVENDSVLSEMTVVKNGFVSLIGWQSQGYVPMTF